MKRSGLYFVFLLLVGSAFPQTMLDLEEALQMARASNRQLKVSDQEVALSRAERAGSSSAFLPRISASYTGMYTDDPLNAFGFKLRHRSVSPMDFDPALLNHPDGQADFNTKFSVAQPILNLDAYAGRAALNSKVAATEHQRQFAAEHLAVEVKASYYNLQFLHEAGKAVEKAVEAYEETLRNTENMLDQGLVMQSDLLMVKVGLTDTKIKGIEIRNALSDLSDNLSWMMGRPGGNVYVPTSPLQLETSLNTDAGLQMQRRDFLAMGEGIEARKKLLAMDRNSLLPRLNAFGEYNLNSKEALDFKPSSYLVGVALSVDLFNGYESRSKISQQKINIEKATQEMELYVEQNALQLEHHKRGLSALQEKVVLSGMARDQADESVRIVEDRYNEGLERTSDLLLAQANHLQKQVDYLKSVLEHNLAVLQIKFLTTP